MIKWITIAMWLAASALSVAQAADVLLPLQFGNTQLYAIGVACSNALDFSKSCNSQYIGTIGLM